MAGATRIRASISSTPNGFEIVVGPEVECGDFVLLISPHRQHHDQRVDRSRMARITSRPSTSGRPRSSRIRRWAGGMEAHCLHAQNRVPNPVPMACEVGRDRAPYGRLVFHDQDVHQTVRHAIPDCTDGGALLFLHPGAE